MNPLDCHNPSIGGNNLELPPLFETRQPATMGRKIYKTQIIKKLSIIMRQFRKVQTKKEVALTDNECLTRKVSKTKEVVEELRAHLKDVCQEVRCCKSIIINSEQDHISSTNATEKKYKRMLNTMNKMAIEKMTAKDGLHALNLESKDNEIRVSEWFVDTIITDPAIVCFKLNCKVQHILMILCSQLVY